MEKRQQKMNDIWCTYIEKLEKTQFYQAMAGLSIRKECWLCGRIQWKIILKK